jgi:hypothetical protein
MRTLTNLRALLREVETKYEVGGDLQGLRSHSVAALGSRATTRHLLGQTLYAYRSALQDGAWMLALRAIAKSRGIAARTISEIVSDYERVNGGGRR